jgi:hypothetical protein
VSGNTYLARYTKAGRSQAGTSVITLVDRLWENSGLSVTSTSLQAVNSAAWPARDANGSTNGEGVYIAVEFSVIAGAATPTITMVYTNSTGTATRTTTNINPIVTTFPAGGWVMMGLNAADTGVRSIQSITLNASFLSGTMHLVAYRPICLLGQYDNKDGAIDGDAVSLGMPKLFNGSVLQSILLSSNGTVTEIGGTQTVQFTQG